VSWDEVEQTLKTKDADRLVFEAPPTVARVEKMGDLFAPVLKLKQRLPDLKAVAAAAETEEPISIAAQAEEEPKKVRRRAVKKAAKPRTRKTARKR
jgi:bifunctional non-homologous end joining protein LigD